MNISWWFDFGTVFFELVSTEVSTFHILHLLYLYSWAVNAFWICLNPRLNKNDWNNKQTIFGQKMLISPQCTAFLYLSWWDELKLLSLSMGRCGLLLLRISSSFHLSKRALRWWRVCRHRLRKLQKRRRQSRNSLKTFRTYMAIRKDVIPRTGKRRDQLVMAIKFWICPLLRGHFWRKLSKKLTTLQQSINERTVLHSSSKFQNRKNQNPSWL